MSREGLDHPSGQRGRSDTSTKRGGEGGSRRRQGEPGEAREIVRNEKKNGKAGQIDQNTREIDQRKSADAKETKVDHRLRNARLPADEAKKADAGRCEKCKRRNGLLPRLLQSIEHQQQRADPEREQTGANKIDVLS